MYEITRGRQQKAQKIVIYGVEGIGKSTFAANFPDPVFIDTEGSTDHMDVARLPKPTSWEMLLDEVKQAKTSGFKTIVIDTIDWAEQLCIKAVCARAKKTGIEEFGYGKGYVYEAEEFVKLLDVLGEVRDSGINVVLTAHAQIKKFEQPDEMGAYDRWEMKLGQKTGSRISPLVKEWADMVLFANYEIHSIAVDDKGNKHKAQGGKRIMYTTHAPCWDAKNRYGLPDKLDFDYKYIADKIPSTGANQTPSQNVPQNAPQALTEPSQTVPSVTIPEGTPKALAELMTANCVSEGDIQAVVASKGYFPIDMPISAYPKEFVDGVLVGAWSDVYAEIVKNGVPF